MSLIPALRKTRYQREGHEQRGKWQDRLGYMTILERCDDDTFLVQVVDLVEGYEVSGSHNETPALFQASVLRPGRVLDGCIYSKLTPMEL